MRQIETKVALVAALERGGPHRPSRRRGRRQVEIDQHELRLDRPADDRSDVPPVRASAIVALDALGKRRDALGERAPVVRGAQVIHRAALLLLGFHNASP